MIITIKYNNLTEKVSVYQGLLPDTITLRSEGNSDGQHPGDYERYDVSFPAKVMSHVVNFPCDGRLDRKRFNVSEIKGDTMTVLFGDDVITLHPGKTILDTKQVKVTTYDGPSFYATEEISLIWLTDEIYNTL